MNRENDKLDTNSVQVMRAFQSPNVKDKNAVTKFTDGVGEVTFFLNPQDANYIFRIDKNPKNTYLQLRVSIKRSGLLAQLVRASPF